MVKKDQLGFSYFLIFIIDNMVPQALELVSQRIITL